MKGQAHYLKGPLSVYNGIDFSELMQVSEVDMTFLQ